MNKQKTPIEKVIDVFNGDQSALAKAMGFSSQNITNIKRRGGNLPRTKLHKWLEVSGLTFDELYPKQ